MADQFNYDVFLSHSSKDKPLVRPLAERLRADGLRVWFDERDINPGSHWQSKIEEGLEQSRVLVVCVSENGSTSDWVKLEVGTFRRRDPLNREGRIILLRLDEAEIKGLLGEYHYINWLPEEQDYTKLLEALTGAGNKSAGNSVSEPLSVQRKSELAYLAWLKEEQLIYMDRYTPVSGGTQQQRRARARVPGSTVPFDKEQQTRPFADAVEEIQGLQNNSGRAVLLGDPGGGKTFILWKLAERLVEAARNDSAAPIPLLIRLGFWTKADQRLPEFMAAQLKGLGPHLKTLLEQKRAALLLDGLNEVPSAQRSGKANLIKQFIEDHESLLAVVSCRKEDYAPHTEFELGFDRLNILPLDALRIREFIERYLKEKAERFFWKLAGQDTRTYHDDFVAKVGVEHEEIFWLKDQLPDDLKWTYDWDNNNEYSRWQDWHGHRVRHCEQADSLLVLARNPYMLCMLVSVSDEKGDLPQNRGEVFRKFVEELLDREEVSASAREPLRAGLMQVAYKMQSQRALSGADGDTDKSNAATVLSNEDVRKILDEQSLKLAGSASLLSLGDEVRFTHQLLQEYFAAQHLKTIRAAGQRATELWPRERWWKRTNWEETAVLLAGLDSDDCSEVVEWIAAANPEVAAQCIVRSGAQTPEATRARLRDEWLKRLDKPELEPEPQARAAIGRALGQIVGLDNRPGVGLNSDHWPDITWIKIPGGEFQYGAEKQAGDPDWYEPAKPRPLKLATFWISRYPITYAQFRCFAEDNGYGDERWWDGLAADDDDRTPAEQSFKFDNHPRDTVNWYEAIAFCRWLSWRKGGGYDLQQIDEWKVRLPTEFEWEKAARGTDGRLYPYGNDFDASKGNVDKTGIGQTSAVGIFPDGMSFYEVEEMSGNVWEWCLSDYNKPQRDARKEKLDTDNTRVLRGGSWFFNVDNARSVYRYFSQPGGRNGDPGFRVVVVRPPS
ncbi:MAG: SUMF1/EgtB/PvdO family nonheme iron enzyme [Acidobacteria bacterium]|nr:SUMF1/EgtB/PvdO family nonheme iron enzyme [Acidobacteriota bacterium]MBI3426071.1 SUMF1/EgtB/PvdO family nonheme iron enzyme [Acidobacteriota bacterium]